MADAVDAAVAAVNADADALDALLERQNYRLAFWRAAGQELDYRRFFDITTLVGLRMENRRVFDDTHAPDARAGRATARSTACASTTPTGSATRPSTSRRLRHAAGDDAWIVVEKILEAGRGAAGRLAGRRHHRLRLRSRASSGLFVDPAGEAPLTELYARGHRRAPTTWPTSSARTSTW